MEEKGGQDLLFTGGDNEDCEAQGDSGTLYGPTTFDQEGDHDER